MRLLKVSCSCCEHSLGYQRKGPSGGGCSPLGCAAPGLVAWAMHRLGPWVGRGACWRGVQSSWLCSPVATPDRAGRPARGGACGGSVIGAYRAVPVCVPVAECLRWLPPGRWRSGSVEFAAVGEGTASFGYGIVRLEDVSGWSRGTCHCCCLGGHGWAFRPEQWSALVAVCAGKVRRSAC